MKQLIDLKSIWFNTKRALYATMVITLAVSIPVLSWVELSHEEEQPETTQVAKTNNNTAKPTNVVLFQKQS